MTAFVLKLAALLTMVIDHTAAVLNDSMAVPILSPDVYMLMRSIGRLAFPIYAFLLVEGFRHTRDWRKYVLRLAGLGLLSQLPYAFTLNGWIAQSSNTTHWQRFTDLNILFTLAIGVLLLAFLEEKRVQKYFSTWGAAITFCVLGALLVYSTIYDAGIWLLIAAGFNAAARLTGKFSRIADQAARFALFALVFLRVLGYELRLPSGETLVLHFDYGMSAMVLIAALYWAKTPRRCAVVCAVWGVLMHAGAWMPIIGILAAAALVWFYNGARGKNERRLFYWAYPAHLFVLWGVFAYLNAIS